MAELAESERGYSLLPGIKNSQFSSDFVIMFGFRKGKIGEPS